MYPTLEEAIRQYHPWKQLQLTQQSKIYQPLTNSIPTYDPTQANIQYYQNQCKKSN